MVWWERRSASVRGDASLLRVTSKSVRTPPEWLLRPRGPWQPGTPCRDPASVMGWVPSDGSKVASPHFSPAEVEAHDQPAKLSVSSWNKRRYKEIWLCFVILLLGSCPRTRTLEQRQVRATSSAAVLLLGSAAPRQSYSSTRLVRSVGFYGSDRPTVLETNRKPLIPFCSTKLGLFGNFLASLVRGFRRPVLEWAPNASRVLQLHCTLPIQGGPGANGVKPLLMRHLGFMACNPHFSRQNCSGRLLRLPRERFSRVGLRDRMGRSVNPTNGGYGGPPYNKVRSTPVVRTLGTAGCEAGAKLVLARFQRAYLHRGFLG